jgi:hypothetical protein
MDESTPLFSHAVYFSLHDNSPDSCQQLVQECRHYLTGHPGTVFFAAGTLADMHREVNDRDFDVMLLVVFESRASHDHYQVADRHQEFVQRNRGRWRQVRVFDADVAR